MGVIFAQDTWQGEITRIYVRYSHADPDWEPDWEHDSDIADVLREMRGRDSQYEVGGAHRILLDSPPGAYDIVIARIIRD